MQADLIYKRHAELKEEEEKMSKKFETAKDQLNKYKDKFYKNKNSLQ